MRLVNVGRSSFYMPSTVRRFGVAGSNRKLHKSNSASDSNSNRMRKCHITSHNSVGQWYSYAYHHHWFQQERKGTEEENKTKRKKSRHEQKQAYGCSVDELHETTSRSLLAGFFSPHLRCDLNLLFFRNGFESANHRFTAQWLVTKLRTTTRQRLDNTEQETKQATTGAKTINDTSIQSFSACPPLNVKSLPLAPIFWPWYIIANNCESGHLRILFHRSSQCRLCIRGHRVALIQDDDFEWRTRIARYRVTTSHSNLCKFTNLVTNHIDTTLIGGIQF